MGVTIGQAYEDATEYEVDEPDEGAEDSVSVTVELTESEAAAREAAAKAAEANAEAVAADRAAQADHLATMETSDPDNPQDANGDVAGLDGAVTSEFDPSEHTNAEVNEAIANTDDEAEKQRILAAEKADQDRAGVAKANTDVPPYDPSAHTAPEVRDYLTNADAKERKRVIAAEKKAAKPRKGIVEFKA